MKKLILVALVAVLIAGCTKSETNIPENQTFNYECNWVSNAYYVLKKNGKTVVSSADSVGTVFTRISDQPYKSGDFIELIVQPLDPSGNLSHEKVHGALYLNGKVHVTNTVNGKIDIYF